MKRPSQRSVVSDPTFKLFVLEMRVVPLRRGYPRFFMGNSDWRERCRELPPSLRPPSPMVFKTVDPHIPETNTKIFARNLSIEQNAQLSPL